MSLLPVMKFMLRDTVIILSEILQFMFISRIN